MCVETSSIYGGITIWNELQGSKESLQIDGNIEMKTAIKLLVMSTGNKKL